MKLIYIKEKDGSDVFLNPMYVKKVRCVKSDYNDDWCIGIRMTADSDHLTDNTHTILCATEHEKDMKLAEIKEAMESI